MSRLRQTVGWDGDETVVFEPHPLTMDGRVWALTEGTSNGRSRAALTLNGVVIQRAKRERSPEAAAEEAELMRLAYHRRADQLRMGAIGPKRADPRRIIQPQRDAAHLPLFVAANEPTLF